MIKKIIKDSLILRIKKLEEENELYKQDNEIYKKRIKEEYLPLEQKYNDELTKKQQIIRELTLEVKRLKKELKK